MTPLPLDFIVELNSFSGIDSLSSEFSWTTELMDFNESSLFFDFNLYGEDVDIHGLETYGDFWLYGIDLDCWTPRLNWLVVEPIWRDWLETLNGPVRMDLSMT